MSVNHPGIAISLSTHLASRGRIRVHPRCYRLQLDSDPDRVFELLRELATDVSVVFDVGANFGITSLVADGAVRDGGTVVAFEPSAQNLKVLEFNMNASAINPFRVERFCVGDHEGMTDFYLLGGDGMHTSNSLNFGQEAGHEITHVKPDQTTIVQVPIRTLDAYCSNTGLVPDVIKIDVEGAELQVLRGAYQTLLKHRPKLMIGVHPFWWPKEQQADELRLLLEELNYSSTKLDGSATTLEDFEDVVCTPLTKSKQVTT
ncbi:FkbM family methyltransferase [Rhodopirellula baltica]|nr:FkbM family methyltransferase [Rhodopirellula baltica]